MFRSYHCQEQKYVFTSFLSLVGADDGLLDGWKEGNRDGIVEGWVEGILDGCTLGNIVGDFVSFRVG